MNERFKELSKQAVDYASACEAEAWDGAYERKFAELIVRECVDWIDGSPTTDAGQLLLSKSFIIANLKGHFGVKE